MAQAKTAPGMRTALLLAAAGAALTAEAPAWSGGGTQRFAVAREKDGSWPVTVGWARIYPMAEVAHPEVMVTTEGGAAVACQLLWTAPGAPADVLFDARGGATAYLVYLGGPGSAGRAPAFDPPAGLVLETRHRAGPGLDTWAQFQEAWRGCAGAVLGASLVPHIFDGIHRHGPSVDYMSHYHGRIQAAKAGEYLFATVSDDGSFVFIDGRPVCEWPGVHGVDGGQRGQHQGAITLSAGAHQLDYWHFQGGGASYAELAWRPPGAERLEVVPPTAFLPVGRFPVARAETAAGAQAAAFAWEMAGHTTIGGEAGGPALVDVRLHLLERAGRAARWVFDDGATAEGVEVEHLFPRAGLRTVRVEVGAGGKPLGEQTRAILVHPVWAQPEDFPEHRWQAQRKELLGRQPLAMPVADLAALIAYGDALHDLELLSRLGPSVLKRAREFAGAQAQALLTLGFHFQHQEVRQYQAAREALAACVGADQAPAELVAQARLHLGGLLIHAWFDAAGARAQLDAVAPDKLSGDDQRLLRMYQGDALLAGGQLEAARSRYLAAGTAAAPGDLHYALLRRTRIETARDYIRQGDYDAAEGVVRAIEWETPLERMGTETGLLLAAVWIARKEIPFALSACRLMLLAAPDDAHRPDVLLALVQAHLAAGQGAEAGAVARQLIAEHPYSEAAARVKDLVAARGAPP